MIDRDARDDLAGLVRRYLNDEVTAFQFDDALVSFWDSADGVVLFVSDVLWALYDDCDDHLVVLSRPQWNYCQRLLLLLESDYSVSITYQRQWTFSQAWAALLFLCCVLGILLNGFGYDLLLWFIPCGVGSIAIARLRPPLNDDYPYRTIVTPFNSLHDLWSACEATGFRKVRYPSQLTARAIRSPLSNQVSMAYSYVSWACLAPIPLLVQCFPTTVSQVHVTPA